jgi:hypothetical protein
MLFLWITLPIRLPPPPDQGFCCIPHYFSLEVIFVKPFLWARLCFLGRLFFRTYTDVYFFARMPTYTFLFTKEEYGHVARVTEREWYTLNAECVPHDQKPVNWLCMQYKASVWAWSARTLVLPAAFWQCLLVHDSDHRGHTRHSVVPKGTVSRWLLAWIGHYPSVLCPASCHDALNCSSLSRVHTVSYCCL